MVRPFHINRKRMSTPGDRTDNLCVAGSKRRDKDVARGRRARVPRIRHQWAADNDDLLLTSTRRPNASICHP